MKAEDAETDFKGVINALLDSMNDKDDCVNNALQKSLCKIAVSGNTDMVLLSCVEYLKNKKKMANPHIGNILSAMEQICMLKAQILDLQTVNLILEKTIKEMVATSDYVPQIQMSASGILVAIGSNNCEEVIVPLMELFKPGTIPHYTIPHTIGSLALTNIKGILPFFKNILSKMLPTLGMLKSDPMKQAYSYAFGSFATALLDFFNNNTDIDNSITLDSFTTEFSIAFDMLFLNWVNSSEPKVTENVLEALASMINLISYDKHSELMPKIIPGIISIYRKSSVDPFYVTQSLSCILLKSLKSENLITSGMVDMINNSLFSNVLTLPDYDQPQKIKNHFEILRCFDILLTNYSNPTLEILYQRAKSNNDDDRMKAIVILTHLISSSEKAIAENFISILKEMIVTENAVKMKRILLKAIVAFAYRESLQEPNNAVLLEYIIKTVSNMDSSTPIGEKNEIEDLYKDCENSLYLLSSTVNKIKPVLWPLLLKALMICKQNNSLSIITKSLTILSQIEEVKNEDNENNENKNTDSTPSHESIFVRCLSLLNTPLKDKIFHNIITFLLKYSENIHKDLTVTWQLELKQLLSYIDSNDFCASIWESMILDLFRSTIYLVNDNVWIENVSHKILEQISQCEHNIAQKGILYKFLAILLCNMVDGENVDKRLDIYFNAIPNCLPNEGTYLAQALGIVSVKHGLKIVEKLDDLCKDIDARKASRFFKFSFIKNNKQDIAMSNIKCIITLCYGEIAKEVLDINILDKLVRTDMEGCGTSIRWVTSLLKNQSSSSSITQAAFTTLYFLSRAIHSISHNNIILQERWDLLNLVLDQVSEKASGKVEMDLFPTIIKATSSLIILPKLLTPEERNVVLRIICNQVYNSISSLKMKSDGLEDQDSCNELIKLMDEIQSSLDSLIKDFMIQSTCPSTLDDILSILEEWVTNKNKDVRIAAMKSTQATLVSFIQNIKLTYENPSRFNQSGLIIGRMVPRCTDKSFTVRELAIDCIRILIQIIDLYEGRSIDTDCDILFKKMLEEICSDDTEKISKVVESLANVITNKVQHQQIMMLTESLLNGLSSNETSGISCTMVLDVVFKNKGQDLHQNVDDIMDLILPTIQNISGFAKESLLEVILTLARQHSKAVIAYLLIQPLPYEDCVCDCWSTFAQDSSITSITIEYFLNVLTSADTSQLIFEESLKYENEKVASVKCLAVISGLCEILSQPQTKTICNQKFADLFSMLYTTLVCFIGATPPAHSLFSDKKNDKFGFIPNSQSIKISPAKVALDTLKAFLINSDCVKIFEELLMCDKLDSSSSLNSFLDIVLNIVRVFCEDYPQHLSKVVISLNYYARASLMSQRIAVVAFFGHLVKFRCNDNLIVLDTVITTLNAGWRDTALEVRAISLSGLSNVKWLKSNQQEPLMESVINTLFHGLDDHQGSTSRTNVPLISIISLTEILLLEKTNRLIDSFAPIAQRIKAFMNTENAALREASIRLFGEIVLKQNSDALKEQALILYPCFLLHLADDDLNVIKACKHTLKKITPSLNAPNTNTMIQNHLIDNAKLHITSFLTDLTKCISTELPQNVPQLIESTTNYLNSPWDKIRCNATVMIGLLFANHNTNFSVENDYEKTKKQLTFRLLQLIKDKNPTVRMSAATALSGLYQST